MPSICDPGEDLVREARSNKINIICIPGPSAAITALVSSGLPSSKFIFEGFLPKKAFERKKILLHLRSKKCRKHYSDQEYAELEFQRDQARNLKKQKGGIEDKKGDV